jgi:hypothetical protein
MDHDNISRLMAPTIDGIREEILQKGFWAQEDADIGKSVDAIVRIHYNTQTEEGMDLCKAAAFKNEVSKTMYINYSF